MAPDKWCLTPSLSGRRQAYSLKFWPVVEIIACPTFFLASIAIIVLLHRNTTKKKQHIAKHHQVIQAVLVVPIDLLCNYYDSQVQSWLFHFEPTSEASRVVRGIATFYFQHKIQDYILPWLRSSRRRSTRRRQYDRTGGVPSCLNHSELRRLHPSQKGQFSLS